jgi:DNA-binding CsgD family transcriptional regulator
MPRSGTRKSALARIQRLCCLGIGSEMLVPDLIRDLAALIPFGHAIFYWVGPDFEISNTYTTLPSVFMDLFFNEFFMTKRQTAVITTISMFKYRPPSTPVQQLDQYLLVDRHAFLRSDFYNILWRAEDIYECLLLYVRSAGRIHGVLHIYRAVGDAPFKHDDLKLLESAAGFVAHGMTRAALGEDAFAGSDNLALFVADLNGTVLHAGIEAQHLLRMALNPVLSPTANGRVLGEPIPEIAWLGRTLAATANGELGQPPPVLRLRTPWGEFVLRAYWLGVTDGVEQTRQIGITIERRVPRALALRRRIEDLPLTAREKQLCLLLARNASGRDLADVMGLAASTVITHQRSVYAKLGVHGRTELLAALEPGWTTSN